MRKWFLGPVLLVALTAGACSRTTVEAPVTGADEGGLEVTGIGRVDVRPDTLVVNMGVSSEADSATGALDAVSEGARAMLAAITENGVPQRDIQTTALNVQPQFDDQGTIVGFTATEMFRVSIQDLEKAGAVVADAVTAAGDDARVEGMSLEVADPEAAKQRARKLAVEDAIRRGEELAATAGIGLGAPTSIRETPGREGIRGFALPLAAAGEAADVAAFAPRIETGTQEVVVRVQVVFEIEKG
jgi:hypothetical protein